MKTKNLITGIGIVICAMGFEAIAIAQDKTPPPSSTTSKTSIETDNGVRTTTKTKVVKTKKSKNGKKSVVDTKTDKKVETDQKK